MNRSFQSEQTCRVVIIEHSLQIIQKIFQLGGEKLIYDQVKREIDILSRKYDKLQKQLLKMPEGELLCAKMEIIQNGICTMIKHYPISQKGKINWQKNLH